MPLYLEGDGAGPRDRRAWAARRWASSCAGGGRRLVYLANCAAVTDAVRERVAGADLLFMDGTLWRDDEMIRAGVSPKTGRRMGHVSMDGPEGAMARLAGVPGRPADLHPRQQHQPGAARRQRRARGARGGPAGRWHRTAWSWSCERDPWPCRSAGELEAALRRIGAERYHNHHPFHRLLHGGRLGRGQVQAWALNRYVYQSHIPLKDAALMSRCADQDLRREWLVRIQDHDGSARPGGRHRPLAAAVPGAGARSGLCALAEQGALPATRFAVEAYVRFVRERSLLEAVASSLTELFAPGDPRGADPRHAAATTASSPTR